MPLTEKLCKQLLAGKVSGTEVATLCGELVQAASGEEEAWADFRDVEDFINLSVAIVCMITAGLAAGLTMGVVSLDELDLRVKARSGSVDERGYAALLLPLIQRVPRHQLLVTLLLLNSVANEALPLFFDKLVPPWAAIVLSVTAVLFAGALMPPSTYLPAHPIHPSSNTFIPSIESITSLPALPQARSCPPPYSLARRNSKLPRTSRSSSG